MHVTEKAALALPSAVISQQTRICVDGLLYGRVPR